MSELLERLASFEPLAVRGAVRSARGPLLRYVVMDVFTDAPLEGNGLAVFPDARALDEQQMQSIARELKLSETVFALPPRGDGDVRIRIFTPAAELPFAGHPVLGSAVLFGAALEREHVVLETAAAAVAVRLQRFANGGGSGWMDQPLPRWRAFEHAPALLSALGVAASGLPVELYENGPRHVYVEVESRDALAALAPDLRALSALGELGVNCFTGAGARWKTRMFAPALGVPEDPATGSAAGPLVVHLARHGRIAFGEEIEISQGAEILRPSLLRALARGAGDAVESVEVGGAAVAVAAGTFAL